MIDNLKPYPAYKDSGVPWLGEIPEHWKLERLRNHVQNVIDQTSDAKSGTRYVALEHVESWTGRVRSANVPPNFNSTVNLFREDDVLFGKLRPYLAKVVRLDTSGCCVGEFFVLRPRDGTIAAPFLEHSLRSKLVIDVIDSSTFGAKMPRADWQIVGNLIYAFPPLPEQLAITRFLDHADRLIRRYIRAKQKLIKLLEEQKQAIIHQAVTRGLDPNVRLKPSGVEWLGDVPEHWDVKRCRYLFREIDKRSSDGSEQHLSMSQRLGLVPSHLVENRTLTSESYAGGKLCNIGDLVLNRLKAHLGVFATAKCEGVISPDYSVFRPLDSAGADYFELILRSPACRHELRVRAKGIVEGFWRLYTDDFYDIRLPVPPVNERLGIVEYMKQAAPGTARTIASAEREIELLREYRTRLIADVVTGKLDVRGWTPPAGSEEMEEEIVDDVEEPIEDAELDEDLEAVEA